MVTTEGEGTPGQWVEARAVAKYPTVHKTATTAKHDPAQNVNSAKVEKPYTSRMWPFKKCKLIKIRYN